MATKIRAKLSEKNKYWIDKHRYYELKHFCLQYQMWKKAYKALDEMASVYPMHRIGKAREAAAAIWYLASDDAGFITGTSISVDGGITA